MLWLRLKSMCMYVRTWRTSTSMLEQNFACFLHLHEGTISRYTDICSLSLSISMYMHIMLRLVEHNKSFSQLSVKIALFSLGCMKLTYIVWAYSLDYPKASQMRVATSLGVDFVDAWRRWFWVIEDVVLNLILLYCLYCIHGIYSQQD